MDRTDDQASLPAGQAEQMMHINDEQAATILKAISFTHNEGQADLRTLELAKEIIQRFPEFQREFNELLNGLWYEKNKGRGFTPEAAAYLAHGGDFPQGRVFNGEEEV